MDFKQYIVTNWETKYKLMGDSEDPESQQDFEDTMECALVDFFDDNIEQIIEEIMIAKSNPNGKDCKRLIEIFNYTSTKMKNDYVQHMFYHKLHKFFNLRYIEMTEGLDNSEISEQDRRDEYNSEEKYLELVEKVRTYSNEFFTSLQFMLKHLFKNQWSRINFIHPLIFSYTPENALRQYQDYYYQTGKYPYANLLWMTIKYCNMCNSLRSSWNHNDKYKELRMELTNVNLNRAMDILKILLKDKTTNTGIIKWFWELIKHINNINNVFNDPFNSYMYIDLFVFILSLWKDGFKKSRLMTIPLSSLNLIDDLVNLRATEVQIKEIRFLNHLMLMIICILDKLIIPLKKERIGLPPLGILGISEVSEVSDLLDNYSPQTNKDVHLFINQLSIWLNHQYYKQEDLQHTNDIFENSIEEVVNDIGDNTNANTNGNTNGNENSGIKSSNLDKVLDTITMYIVEFPLLVEIDNDNIVTLAMNLIHNKILTNSPHIRMNGLNQVIRFIVNNENIKASYLYNKTLISIWVNNLSSFFIELNDIPDELLYYKLNTRHCILIFLSVIMVNPSQMNQFKTLVIMNRERMIRFVYLLIDDLTYLLENGLANVENIKKLEQDIEEIELQISQNEQNHQIHHNGILYRQEKKRLKEDELIKKQKINETMFCTIEDNLRFIVGLSLQFGDLLLAPENIEQFCSLLNFNLNELVNKENTKKYTIKCKDECNFKPIEILNLIFQIYSYIGTDTRFIESIVTDSRSFSIDNLNRMSRILMRKRQGSERLISGFSYLVQVAESKHKKFIEQRVNIEDDDIPDEFCDPIMSTLIENPIVIPEVDLIMDEKIIKMHLMSTNDNPFTRTKLCWEELQDYNRQGKCQDMIRKFEISKREWLNSKRSK